MKYYLKFVLMSAAMALQGVCNGGVPLEWTRRPDSTTPANFTASGLDAGFRPNITLLG